MEPEVLSPDRDVNGFTAFAQYGVGNFMPSFLYRSHGMTSAEIGTALGLIIGFGGVLGTYLGGKLGDGLGARDSRWYIWIGAAAGTLGLPFAYGAYLVPDKAMALALLVVPVITSAVYLAPSIAISHALVPAAMRSLVSAILFFVLNIIGLGLGPLMTGAVSDALAPQYGADSLRYAMVATASIGLIGALLAVLAARHLPRDLATARSEAKASKNETYEDGAGVA